MSGLLDNTQSRCDHFQEWLEESRSPQSGLETYENLMSSASPDVRLHAQECSDCREAAEDIVALRNLVREFEAAPVAGPWFAPRVIAVINSLEAERSRASNISVMESAAIRPRPTSRNVPTMLRTIWCKNPEPDTR